MVARVLVVDDHPINRNLVVTLLGYRGHTVLEACDGAEALAMVETERPDLVITDLLMPVMDGYELVRELRASPALAATRVIFYTANYLLDEARPLAAASGVRYILPKPADPELLLELVEEALADDESAPPASHPEDLQREHLRALSAKLVDKVRELEATQAALVSSEAKFRSFAESSPIGIFSLASDGRLSYGNPRLRQICGLSDDPNTELPGWADLIHTDDRERFVLDLAAAVTRVSRYRGQVRVVRAGGETRWAYIQAAPVLHDGDPVTYVGTVEDITGVLDGRRQRDELVARLHASERLESLGQLAAGIAHDFNNLLGAMLNYTEFVSSGIQQVRAAGANSAQFAQIGDDLGAIRRAAERAAELTNQLLVFGRREILHHEVIDLNGLVDDTTKLLSRTIGEHINLRSVLDPDLWPVSGDRSRLEQVLVNLVVNARDAIGAAGTVVISTDRLEVDLAATATQPGVAAGNYSRLTVTDNGSGMAPEIVARVFEPFFTTKPRGKGTGLGLATAYGVVNQLGGHMAIDSQLGVGTSVHVCLPPADHAPVPAPPERPAVRGQGEVILVVDDDEDLGVSTARILVENGYVATHAASAGAAVAMIEDPSARIDLLLTDIVMPEMSGRELAELAGRAQPDLPVLFMSGYPDDFLGSDNLGGTHVVPKPFTQALLLRSVAATLGTTTRINDHREPTAPRR